MPAPESEMTAETITLLILVACVDANGSIDAECMARAVEKQITAAYAQGKAEAFGKRVGEFMGLPMHCCEHMKEGFALVATLEKGKPQERYQIAYYHPERGLGIRTVYPDELIACISRPKQ